MDACPGHIFEYEIEIKLKDVYERKEVQKTRTIVQSYISLELSLLNSFHKKVFFFVISECTSSV